MNKSLQIQQNWYDTQFQFNEIHNNILSLYNIVKAHLRCSGVNLEYTLKIQLNFTY